MALITCTSCGFSQEVPDDKVPKREVSVQCPKCRFSFLYDGGVLLPPNEPELELVLGNRARAPAPVPDPPPGREVAAPPEVPAAPQDVTFYSEGDDGRLPAAAQVAFWAMTAGALLEGLTAVVTFANSFLSAYFDAPDARLLPGMLRISVATLGALATLAWVQLTFEERAERSQRPWLDLVAAPFRPRRAHEVLVALARPAVDSGTLLSWVTVVLLVVGITSALGQLLWSIAVLVLRLPASREWLFVSALAGVANAVALGLTAFFVRQAQRSAPVSARPGPGVAPSTLAPPDRVHASTTPCTRCGAEVEDLVRHCPQCGVGLTVDLIAEPWSRPEQARKAAALLEAMGPPLPTAAALLANLASGDRRLLTSTTRGHARSVQDRLAVCDAPSTICAAQVDALPGRSEASPGTPRPSAAPPFASGDSGAASTTPELPRRPVAATRSPRSAPPTRVATPQEQRRHRGVAVHLMLLALAVGLIVASGDQAGRHLGVLIVGALVVLGGGLFSATGRAWSRPVQFATLALGAAAVVSTTPPVLVLSLVAATLAIAVLALAGRPSGARSLLAMVLVWPLLAGLFVFGGSRYTRATIGATTVARLAGEIEARETRHAANRAERWTLDFPEGWHAARHVEKPAEAWVNPAQEARIEVRGLSIAGIQGFGPNKLRRAMLVATAGPSGDGLEYQDDRELTVPGFDLAHSLSLQEPSGRGNKTVRLLLVAVGDRAYLLKAEIATRRAKAEQESLARVLLSFRAARPLRPAPPAALLESGPRETAFIVAGQFSGSGWLYHPDPGTTIVVTNAHVVHEVPEAAAVDVVTIAADGTRVRSRVQKSDFKVHDDVDLALAPLELPGTWKKSSIRRSAEVPPGTGIWSFGFPFGFLMGWGELPEFTVNAGWQGEAPDGGAGGFLRADLGINPGNSGGPVFDEHGELVGIVTAKVLSSQTGLVRSTEELVKVLERDLPSLAVPMALGEPPQAIAPIEAPPLASEAALRVGRAQVYLGPESAEISGLIISRHGDDLLIVTDLDAQPGAHVEVRAGNGTVKGEGLVVRSMGLSLVRVRASALPGCEPLPPHVPSGAGLDTILYHARVRWAPGSAQAQFIVRPGRMSSRARSSDGEARSVRGRLRLESLGGDGARARWRRQPRRHRRQVHRADQRVRGLHVRGPRRLPDAGRV